MAMAPNINGARRSARRWHYPIRRQGPAPVSENVFATIGHRLGKAKRPAGSRRDSPAPTVTWVRSRSKTRHGKAIHCVFVYRCSDSRPLPASMCSRTRFVSKYRCLGCWQRPSNNFFRYCARKRCFCWTGIVQPTRSMILRRINGQAGTIVFTGIDYREARLRPSGLGASARLGRLAGNRPTAF